MRLVRAQRARVPHRLRLRHSKEVRARANPAGSLNRALPAFQPDLQLVRFRLLHHLKEPRADPADDLNRARQAPPRNLQRVRRLRQPSSRVRVLQLKHSTGRAEGLSGGNSGPRLDKRARLPLLPRRPSLQASTRDKLNGVI